MTTPYAGDVARLDSVDGRVTRLVRDRNLWWRVTPDSPEILFSLRRDGVWRLVGGRADASGLRFTEGRAKVLITPQQRHKEAGQ